MTTTVSFVRHGSHDRLGRILCGRMPGVILSEQGRAEARGLAQRLSREPIVAIYASPLERARQTAEPIAEALGLPVQVAADLQEIDFGAWTGARFEDLDGDPAWGLWNQARTLARAPGGESMLEVQLRLRRWLDAACERHSGQLIAAVSHGDAIKAILAQVLGLSLDQHQRLEISPASVSTVAVGDWGAKVLGINEAPR
ncbi:histidine phosphatase family protein [Phenylobacterium hankyongense]|uniref:Histidine phosphatase family protein n=1 Tax=Phenylobacterium hankyongense TaxID=1813876 RepID=A0A328B4X8_9CAUL|nr:histidine phosphatase family protein [Phenylobacterium hankyongense]RAK60924.1 histidine phosphatase family protein [Phenylobacterium hankyongense]